METAERPHLVLWTCLCSETAADRAALPDHCPGHGKPIAAAIRCFRPGPTAIRHDCPDFRPCAKES